MSEYRLIPQPKRIEYGNGKLAIAGALEVRGDAKTVGSVRAGLDEVMLEWNRLCSSGGSGRKDGAVTGLVLGVDTGSGLREEAYRLTIDGTGITIRAFEARGLFYGLQTLLQMLQQSETAELTYVQVEDDSDLALRGVLVDLRFQSYRMEYLLAFVKQIARFKINTLVIEYSNKFPYQGKYEVIRDVNAFTVDEVKQFVECCREHFVEMIPLVQSFGHMEYLLHHDDFKYLREDPNFLSQCCPLHEDSIACTRDLLKQIHETHRYSTKLFIGGDETFHLGKCPKCSAFTAERGKGGLYVHYANQLAHAVLELGLEPITCSDMLLAYPEVIDELNPAYAIADWDYWTVEPNPPFMKDWKTKRCVPRHEVAELPEETKRLFQKHLIREDGTYRAFGYTKYFIERGFKTYALPSTASVGPDCYWVPQYAVHTPNIMEYSRHGKQYGIAGTMNTAWERFLFETTLYGIAVGAEYGWGEPSGGMDTFNRNFANLYFGLDAPELVEAFYTLTAPYAIVEKRFPRIYTNRAYGREDIPMEEIAVNTELSGNIERAAEVFGRYIPLVERNRYAVEQWRLGTDIKRFWLDVLRTYVQLKRISSEAAGNEGDAGEPAVEREIRRLDAQLDALQAAIAEVLLPSMPAEKVALKNGESFKLWDELKTEIRTGAFR